MIPSSGTWSGEYTGDAKIRVNGHLKITDATIHNTARVPWQPTLLLDSPDDVLECEDCTFVGESFDLGGGKWAANRCIEMNGGGRLILTRCNFRNGDSVLARRGRVEIRDCRWPDTTFGYNLYLGDCNTNPADTVTGIIDRCHFRASRREASVRLMGFDGLIRACGFMYHGSDEEMRHSKEWLQIRHGRVVVDSCDLMPVAVGPLKYDDPGDGGKSFAYATANPTWCYIRESRIIGPIRAQGNARVALDGVRSVGRDPRNGIIVNGMRYEDENSLCVVTAFASPTGIQQRPEVAQNQCWVLSGARPLPADDPDRVARIAAEAGWREPTPQPEPQPEPEPQELVVEIPAWAKRVKFLP